MRHTNVLKIDQGFTLPEVMTVVVIVGILAAFAAPGFLAWNQRKQMDAAISNVEGAIKEAQRQAMAKSRECNVSFTAPSTTPLRISSSNGCLVTGTRTLENIRQMQVSIDDSSFPTTATSLNLFSHTGQNMNASPVTVVLTHSGNTNLRKCVVVSSPLGLIGTGEYRGTSGTISARCVHRNTI
ncbi:MAG: type II secretion system protein [Nostocales cyanobacterium]|nr:MAG: type II secretion system protein [Nostocales cyanobacterium]TAF18317.1 MAG: type II secretion system protein [Nostocales cyanobacterium]